MKNKGLTLVEMIAVIVVLALLLVIIVPNITKGIKKSRRSLTNVQLNAIKEAAASWAMDNIDKVPDEGQALKIKLSELGDYLSDDVINPEDNIDEDECIVIIKQEEKTKNYKFEYGAYLSLNDYYKKKAIEYVKDNDNESGYIDGTTLNNAGYIDELVDLNGNVTEIPSGVDVTVTESNGEYSYSAEVD